MLQEKIHARSWLAILLRLFLFAGIQGIFALMFAIIGKDDAWNHAANWWPIVVGIANVICLFLLVKFFKSEGMNFWRLFNIDKSNIGRDLLAMLGFLVIAGPLAYFPNVLLGKWLFGDANATLDLFIRPLPYWAIYASMILFPITQGLAETPMYFMYAMPRLQKSGYAGWLALGLPAVFLSLQHIAIPLLFDGRFITWRALMYLPFSILVGLLLRWRPRLMPFFAITHILMDLATALMLLPAGY